MTDDLDDLDLRAWQAPPPPKGLAESVIARVTATDEAIAVAMRGARRRYSIIGAACAGTVAAGLALWLGLRPAPAVADDVIMATESQHVAFGASTVDLEPGSAIRTHRIGDELHVVQSGTATWRVASNERLVIDAGSSASIEATGVSLRVETKMNPSYVRVMSGVALTAASVALVSATVYEGFAKVKTADDVVVVAPQSRATMADHGSSISIELVPPEQPVVVHPLDVRQVGDLAIAPGTSARIYKMGGGPLEALNPLGVLVEFQAPCELSVKGHGANPMSWFPTTKPAANGVVVVPLAQGYYEYTATCTGGAPMSGTLDIRDDLCRHRECGDAEDRLLFLDAPEDDAVFAPPTVHVAGRVVDGATLTIGHNVIPTDEHHAFALDLDYAPHQTVALRVDHPTRGTQFYLQRSHLPQEEHTGAATVARPTHLDVSPPKPAPAPKAVTIHLAAKPAAAVKSTSPCDADALLEAGTEAFSTGDAAGALKSFEASYACKADPRTGSLAFMASCNAANVPVARKWWRKLSADEQNHMLVMCIRKNITRDQLDR